MKQMELYRQITERAPVSYTNLTIGQQIAVKHPGELDIMTIAAIGYTPLEAQVVAVGLVSPSEAPFIIGDTGYARLSPLRDLQSQRIRREERPYLVGNPGQPGDGPDILRDFAQAYWIPLYGARIIPISGSEMKSLQELLRINPT